MPELISNVTKSLIATYPSLEPYPTAENPEPLFVAAEAVFNAQGSAGLSATTDLLACLRPNLGRDFKTAAAILGTACPVIMGHVKGWAHSLVMPMTVQVDNALSASKVLVRLKCRSEIERSLEYLAGLNVGSFRLCENPSTNGQVTQALLDSPDFFTLDIWHRTRSVQAPALKMDRLQAVERPRLLAWPAAFWTTDRDHCRQLARLSKIGGLGSDAKRFQYRAESLIEDELLNSGKTLAKVKLLLPVFAPRYLG